MTSALQLHMQWHKTVAYQKTEQGLDLQLDGIGGIRESKLAVIGRDDRAPPVTVWAVHTAHTGRLAATVLLDAQGPLCHQMPPGVGAACSPGMTHSRNPEGLIESARVSADCHGLSLSDFWKQAELVLM